MIVAVAVCNSATERVVNDSRIVDLSATNPAGEYHLLERDSSLSGTVNSVLRGDFELQPYQVPNLNIIYDMTIMGYLPCPIFRQPFLILGSVVHRST